VGHSEFSNPQEEHTMNKRLLMIAGEASGDIHGAKLAKHLFRLVPSLKIVGIGGSRMKQSGVEILYDISDMGVVGIWEIIPRLGSILKAYRIVTDIIRSGSVDFIVLIDYPGFNIKVAGIARRLGIPVVYYIGPQVWAWKRGRIRALGNRVRKMIVVFPFEEPIYKDAGIDCSFVGHPLVDDMIEIRPYEELVKEYGIDKDRPVLGLFPGSRTGEVRLLLRDFLETVARLKESYDDIQVVIGVADSLDFEYVRGIVSTWSHSRGNSDAFDVKMIRGNANEVLSICDAVIVASGTITLQAALLGKPMVIAYKVSLLTYMIARILVRIKDIGLVNILAGKRVVSELIQGDARPEKIALEAEKILKDKEHREQIKKELQQVKSMLGPPGASERGARIIADMMS